MSVINKKIEFGLSESEINRAIEEIEIFQKYLTEKTELLKKRVCEVLSEKASFGFSGAIADDITELSGGPRYANVDVSIEEDGDVLIVIAKGDDAIWVEFGSGVYHNGPVGSSPNPLGSELGFSIGGFGKQGGREAWAFKDENGERKFTHGTPANMPMYMALEEVIDDLKDIVAEVFNSND